MSTFEIGEAGSFTDSYLTGSYFVTLLQSLDVSCQVCLQMQLLILLQGLASLAIWMTILQLLGPLRLWRHRLLAIRVCLCVMCMPILFVLNLSPFSYHLFLKCHRFLICRRRCLSKFTELFVKYKMFSWPLSFIS